MKIIATLLLTIAAMTPSLDDEESLPPFEESFVKGVLLLVASEDACYRLDVYFAVEPAQRNRGLMYVRNMPEMTGMIFIYDFDARLSMYMRNTYIPLDMLFIRADGTVSSIAYDTEPQSLTSVSALEPVRYVLELNAGMADSLGLDKYSRVEWDGMPLDE